MKIQNPIHATRLTRPTAEVIEHQGAWFNAAGAELRRRLPADIAEPIIAAALKGRADAKATLEKYWRSRSKRGRV
jgi:CelD/BcsL family acetyltransferase involved in cellulose biosynthesis